MNARVVAIAVGSLLLGGEAARADRLRVERVFIVGRADAEAPWTTAPTEARADQRAELAAVALVRGPNRRRRFLAPAEVRPLIVAGRRIPDRELGDPSELDGAALRWSLVEPHAWRREGSPAANGATSAYHSNVSTEPGDFGRWLGFDNLEYFETPLDGRAWRRPAVARPSDDALDVFGGLGTVRYRIALAHGGREVASPGPDAVDRAGALPSVHRVSIRLDDTIRGHLAAYFLVPEVFGSAGGGRDHQTERFTGADCADVLTGAIRRAGYRRVWHTSVAALGRYARRIAGPAALAPDRGALDGVKAGDLIRIDYGGSLAGHTPRAFDHVAMLWEDRSDPGGPAAGGPDGALDRFDLVVHMGHPRLELEPLGGQLPATIDVLRLEPRRIGPRTAARSPGQRGKLTTTGR